MAVQRLRKFTKKLCLNKELALNYDKAIQVYLESGHAEHVTESASQNPVYYMPHQPVIRNDSTTTKRGGNPLPISDGGPAAQNGGRCNPKTEQRSRFCIDSVNIVSCFLVTKAFSCDFLDEFPSTKCNEQNIQHSL